MTLDYERLASQFAVQNGTAERLHRPSWPVPIYADELSDEKDNVEFVWDGCVALGHMTLYSALMKAGKSTFLGHFLRGLQQGSPFLGRQTRKCRSLVVSEESRAIWRRRKMALGLDNHLSLLCRPMIAKPSLAEWIDFVGHVQKCASERECQLVVFDTIGYVAPWRNENDAADVQGTMNPLSRLTQDNLAVLHFHHFGKADGSEGRAARGSTALGGAMDVILEHRRFKPSDCSDRRRVLSGLGRFEEAPDEMVITLAQDGSGYTCEGDRKAVSARELTDAIRGVLPIGPPGSTADEVHAALPKGGRPRRGDVGKALQAGGDSGAWQMSGTGKPRDPWRYWLGQT